MIRKVLPTAGDVISGSRLKVRPLPTPPLDRFAFETSLALYAGMTRLDNSSGAYVGTKNTRQVNTQARAAMMTAAARHIDNAPESRAYYDKKRAEGKTHNQAVRALGRHLISVIWSMITRQRNYVSKDSTT